MVTNQQLIQKFKQGITRGNSSGMKIEGNILYSYNTPIAIKKGKIFYMNSSKYSTSTSKQQYYIKQHIPSIKSKIAKDFIKLL